MSRNANGYRRCTECTRFIGRDHLVKVAQLALQAYDATQRTKSPFVRPINRLLFFNHLVYCAPMIYWVAVSVSVSDRTLLYSSMTFSLSLSPSSSSISADANRSSASQSSASGGHLYSSRPSVEAAAWSAGDKSSQSDHSRLAVGHDSAV